MWRDQNSKKPSLLGTAFWNWLRGQDWSRHPLRRRRLRRAGRRRGPGRIWRCTSLLPELRRLGEGRELPDRPRM